MVQNYTRPLRRLPRFRVQKFLTPLILEANFAYGREIWLHLN